MAEPYVGQVIAVGFSFAPQGWLPCDGSLQSIANYQTLFALIGTTYGGDGQSTFAMPDLRGRGALGSGQGTGLQNYSIGQLAGTEAVMLLSANMPAHSHLPQAQPSAATGATETPSNAAVFGGTSVANNDLYGPAATSAPALVSLNNTVVTMSGDGGQPHDNMQPVLTINYIIAAEGIFPSRP